VNARFDFYQKQLAGVGELKPREVRCAEQTDRLLGEAERMVATGFKAGAPALVAAMQREMGGGDDCALVLIWRTLALRRARQKNMSGPAR